jgi:hypothetical protein
MALRRQKSRKQQVTDLAADYLKLKAAGKAAKGAKKAAKGTAVYKVAKKTPVVKRVPVIVGAAGAVVAAAVAAKVLSGRHGEPSPA